MYKFMLELLEIKSKDNIYLTRLKELATPLLEEFYIPLISKDCIETITYFLNEEILAQEIKDKRYKYYFICHNSRYIGFIEMHKKEDMLNISRFFLKKEYRKKGLAKRILNELIIPFAKNQNLNFIRICINTLASNAAKIFKKLGFKPIKEIVRYIGNKIYIFEYVYLYDIK